MIKYLQLPFHFNVRSIQEEVQLLSATAWKLHFQSLHYEGDWSAIPLRSLNGKADSIIPAILKDHIISDTVFLESSPYLRSVLNSFKCPLKNVRLMKLNAGSVIKEHCDHELSYEFGSIRLHIPVVTHDDVELYLQDERIFLSEGECWYLNFNLPHRISNNSNIDRIHLVIDATVNDWVHSLFSDPAIRNKKEIEEPVVTYDEETKKLMIIRFREMNTETSNRMADELEEELEN